MKQRIIAALASVWVGTFLMGASLPAASQPLRIIVPFAPGGSTDAIARAIGPKLGEVLGQSVVIDNRAGGGTVIGTQALQASLPDGNTIMLTTPDFVVNAFIIPKLPYDPLKDFVPVSTLALNQLVMTSAATLPARSVADVLKLAKADPGGVTYASAGVGSTAHLAGELLQMLAGIKLTHVAYKGMGPAMVDLISGRTQLTFVSWTTVEQQVAEGKLRALGVTSPQRVAMLPNVPAIAETVPGYELRTWFGILAPKGTSPDTVARLQQALVKAINSPDVQRQQAKLGIDFSPGTPGQFSALLQSEYKKWGAVVKAANIKPE